MYFFKNSLLFILIVLCCFVVSGRSNVLFTGDLLKKNDSLKSYFKEIAKERNDETKKELNSKILVLMREIIETEQSFLFNFDSVPHLGKIISKDGRLKLVNWNLIFENGAHEYFGFIQYKGKNGKYYFYELQDKSENISDPEDQTLTEEMWYGALYYQIAEVKIKGKKYYTLFGWDGYSQLKNRKIVDVLYFSAEGKPKFGAPLFASENKETKRRLIFEYANRASMTLNYDEERNMIVYDHLSPPKESLAGQYQYYGPDGSYDAYEFKKDKWVFVSDIDARNNKNKKLKKGPKNKLP